MIKEYKSIYECDCGGEVMHGLIWSPELTGHGGMIQQVTDITGFEKVMIKSGCVFCIDQNAGKNVFKYENKEFFITDSLCNFLKQNSVQVPDVDVSEDDIL